MSPTPSTWASSMRSPSTQPSTRSRSETPTAEPGSSYVRARRAGTSLASRLDRRGAMALKARNSSPSPPSSGPSSRPSGDQRLSWWRT
jgi:hypothetical protein